jgi:hypothetical protein
LSLFLPTAAYRSYPFVALDESALLALREAGHSSSLLIGLGPLLRLLENFLRVTGQQLSAASLSTQTFESVYRQFAGVIHSSKFLDASPAKRISLTTQWVAIARGLRKASFISFEPGLIHALEPEVLAAEVEQLPLIPEMVRLYAGWRMVSSDDRGAYLHLYQIHAKFGASFCDRYFHAIEAFVAGRRKGRLPAGIAEFTKFLVNCDLIESSTSLTDSRKVFYVLRDFCVHFFLNGQEAERTSTVSHSKGEWADFLSFYKDHLVTSGIFSGSAGPYPAPPRSPRGGIRHLSLSGDSEVITGKLLTPVPLELTDTQAIQILFVGIKQDIQAIRDWAENQCDLMWHRHMRRQDLANVGIARKIESSRWLNTQGGTKDRANPRWIEDAAATFSAHGYLCARDVRLKDLYGTPLPQAATELAMPTTGSLVPHCCILVTEHHQITDAFLEDLLLYDDAGKRIGIEETDAGTKLIGAKPRRGPRSAQQSILLSPKALQIVNQIIAVTQPVRDYLRAKGDRAWRYLLLTTGSAFGWPRRGGRISSTLWHEIRTQTLAEQLESSADLDSNKARRLAERFSLTRLRASCGIRVYLETMSVQKMAEALGHAEYRPRLLASYLPEPIARFFAERWIRIFQNAFIVEVMKDRPLLSKVTDFKTPEQLNEFMKNHVLTVPPNLEPNEVQPTAATSNDGQVIFTLAPETLAALMRTSRDLAQSVDVDPVLKYWSAVSDHLVAYIEEQLKDREDIQSCLADAKSMLQAA